MEYRISDWIVALSGRISNNEKNIGYSMKPDRDRISGTSLHVSFIIFES